MRISTQLRLVAALIAAFLPFALASSSNFEAGRSPQQQLYTPSVIERDLVSIHVNPDSILEEHTHFSSDFAHARALPDSNTLVYVTPWNNHGYDVAKIFKGKFSHVSPVWYSIKPVRTSGSKSRYELHGANDVDQGWISDVRVPEGSADSDIQAVKIVPRFQLLDFGQEDVMPLVQERSHAEDMADVIVAECMKQEFDGFVLEFQIAGFAQDFVKILSAKARGASLEFFLVIPPIRDQERVLFQPDHFEALKDYVDGFSLMTYDYSNPNSPGPNSPISWVEENILTLCPDIDSRHKLLVGMNMYGNDYSRSKGETVTGSSYLKLIEQYNPKFVWQKETAEHFFKYKKGSEDHVVWYPTLKSIDTRISLFEEMGVGISVWEIGQGLDYFYDLL
ncbi:Chitinase domain-containing protein 1 [Chytridiales sp. JEL 0842]|nr:Chitinase domain-containing protein 1 [Chytridiales sp. JEL 0842]